MTDETAPQEVTETPDINTAPEADAATQAGAAEEDATLMGGTVEAASEKPKNAVRPLGPQAKPTAGGFYWGTGRRKAAVARVRIKPGEGKFLVNKKEHDKYFVEERDQNRVMAPMKVTKTDGKLDVFVNVKGGGYMGQAGAVLLGLSRALKGYDPTLENVLRDNDFLTRDAREVERKKYGQRGARRRFQFSKR